MASAAVGAVDEMTTARSAPNAAAFTGRIDRRLSVVFGALFALVLVVGGTSLYLLGSLLIRAGALGQESEHVHLEERVHRLVQDLLGTVERVHLRPATLSAAVVRDTVADLDSLLVRYERTGGSAPIVRELRAIVDDTARIAHAVAERAAASGVPLDAPDLDRLEATRARLRTLTDRIAADHAGNEREHVRQTHRRLRITLGINAAFLVVGSLGLLASRRHFHRAIAVPLRRLTERSHEIAQRLPDRAIEVTSTDEIGALSHAFNRMAAQLKDHEEKLKGLVILEERERLARELHDDLAQDLAFVRLKLVEAGRGLPPDGDAPIRSLVRELLGVVDAAYVNLRTAILGLRGLDLTSEGGLVRALEAYLDDLRAVRKLPVTLHAPSRGALTLPPSAEQQLFRIIHEALTNVAKHAEATRASVTLERDGDTARVTVEDDGIGFVVDKVRGDGPHFGLPMMRDRAHSAGGTLEVESAPGHGTRVTVRLPLARS